MKHEYSKSKQKGIHAVKSGKERVIIDGIWSLEVPAGYSYCAEYERTATDINGNHYRLQVQKTDSCNFSESYGSEVSLTVKDNVIEFNNYTSDARDAKEILMQCASPIGNVELIKEDKNILVAICESIWVPGNYAFYVIAGGRNVMYSGQVTFADDTGLNEVEVAKSFVRSIEPVLIKDLATGEGLVRLPVSYLPHFDTGKYLEVDNSFRVPIPEGYETKYDLSSQIKAAVVPKNAVFTSSGVRCKLGFVMYQDPINAGTSDTRTVIDAIKKFFVEQTGINFYNWPITTVRDTSKGTIVYSTITNTPCDQNTNPVLVVTGGKAYHCFIVITYDGPISDESDTKWDADIITTTWLSKILFKGEKKPDKAKDSEVMFEKGFPDKSLYPHYDHLMNVASSIPGVKIVVNQSGTEYAFYGIKTAAESDNDELGEKRRALYSRIAAQDKGGYDLDQDARKMSAVFHVDPSVFDMRNDREAELLNNYMKRAYLFSALRSFGWTLSDYCGKKKKLPGDLSVKELEAIVDFIAKRNWLNYDAATYCKGLCAGADLHVFYVPDGISEDDKSELLPSQVDYDRIQQMKSISPSYYEILPDVQSLDALRGSLKFVYPAIKTLHDDLAKKRNHMKPLEGNESDIVYAWCALAMAAKEPFFTEDGPTTYFLSQPEHTEAPVEPVIPVKNGIEKGIITVGDNPVRITYDNAWTIEIPAGYSYCNDPEVNAVSAKGSPYKLIISQKLEKEVFTDRLDGTFVIRMLETTISDEKYFSDMLKGEALFDHVMLDDVGYIYPDDSIAISYHEFLGTIMFFVVTPKKKYCGQAIFRTRPGKKSEQKLRSLLETIRNVDSNAIRTSERAKATEKKIKENGGSNNKGVVQESKGVDHWSFREADTSKTKTKLLSNDKGYAARILSIAEVNKEEDLQQVEMNFRRHMTAFNPDYHEDIEIILPLAEKYASLFISDNGNNDLEEGKLGNTAPVHALRSFVWTAVNIGKKGTSTDFPVDAPQDMWIELARFIQSKGYVNYKPCKPESKEYGGLLFMSKEVGLIYSDGSFKYDDELVKSIQYAIFDNLSLFELVSILRETSPVMELYYKEITESDDSDSIDVKAMKCILQGWTAFAYASRTPFCIVQKSSYKGGNIYRKPIWNAKCDIREYQGGKYLAIGTSLIDVKCKDEVLCIPEGITDIYFNSVYSHHWNPEFAKKIVYPSSFTGTVVIPSNAEEVEIWGDFDALELQAYEPHASLPNLKKIVCNGTANSLEYGFANTISEAANLKEIVFPEGLKEISDINLTYDNNIEMVRLPNSLESIEETSIDYPDGMRGGYPITTFVVYRTCVVRDLLKRQLKAEEKEIREWNDIFKDSPEEQKHHSYKVKEVDAPWISSALTFVSQVSKLYEKGSAEGVEADMERIVRSAFESGRDFRLSKDCIIKEAKKEGLSKFAEIINNTNDIDKLPVVLADDIKNTIESRIQKEIEKKREEEEKRKAEIMNLSQSESLPELDRAILLLKTYFGESSEAEEVIKKCIDKISDIKSDKYAQACNLAEEGTETSISTAISLLKEISPFDDSESRIMVYQKKLEDEMAYNRAVSMMSGTDIANLVAVKESFEGLGDYKDSCIKAAACEKYLSELCEKKYLEAEEAQAVCTVDSQTLAIAAYNELGDYKDALERIAICTSNITVIQEMLDLEEQLGRYKEELKSLTGFFKRRQREEKEALINRVEQQIEELKDRLEEVN